MTAICTCLGVYFCIYVHVSVIILYVFVRLCVCLSSSPSVRVCAHVPVSDSGDVASSRDADPPIIEPVNHCD